LSSFETAPPREFDGPGGAWSPETLLCASLADCFILTFRALSRATRFEWLDLDCRVEGLLERVGKTAEFTRFTTHATLKIAPGSDAAKAHELLERAEHGCLVANSLRGARELQASVVVGETSPTAPRVSVSEPKPS
jgi:organic hydroperoxide reductase OsmC/OhrA